MRVERSLGDRVLGDLMKGSSRGVANLVVVLAAMTSLAFSVAAGRAPAAAAEPAYGPYGPQGPRLREQLWLVPGGDRAVALRATLFRPAEAPGEPPRRPLVVINHGSDAATREAVAMPVFYWLSKWFVERGYVVLVPQRRGHGATGGDFVEGKDRCVNPDHHSAGTAGADDIQGALQYLAAQPFIDASHTIVVGVSTGGWASLALAARNPPGVRMVVNFAGGRGGHAYGEPNAVCGPQRLIEAAGAFGRASQVPTLWFYARNDSYFGPQLASAMAKAWNDNGGSADLRLMPDFGYEGHELAADRSGSRIWGADLERALARAQAAPGGTEALVTGSIKRAKK
jgi:dienelactone hydrolase